jgi:hypothetical protein
VTRRSRHPALAASLSLLAACALALTIGPPAIGPAGAALPEIPPPSAAGRFEGTWFRQEPGAKQVVWIRQVRKSGPPEVRLYWWTDQGFEFDSDWKTRAEFAYRGFAGSLELTVDRKASTPEQVLVRYRREQDGIRTSHLTETGDVRLQRLGDMGWELVWIQNPMKTLVTVGEPLEPGQERVEREGNRIWVFQKASHRILPLDEIPW